MATNKSTVQGLEIEDLALLLHGIRSIRVADQEPRRDRLEKKISAELLKHGVSDIEASW